MAIGEILKNYLDSSGAVYQVISHPHSSSSMETAEAAHVPGERLAKAVVVKDEGGYLMVVVPSLHHVELGTLHHRLERRLRMVMESELAELFPDCEVGAIPPFAGAYGIDSVWDVALASPEDLYCEAGDHEHLIRMSGEQFARLMGDAPQDRYSHRF